MNAIVDVVEVYITKVFRDLSEQLIVGAQRWPWLELACCTVSVSAGFILASSFCYKDVAEDEPKCRTQARRQSLLSLTGIAMEVDDCLMEHPATSVRTRRKGAANLLAIVILSQGKCGLSKCITLYLVGMAAADLVVVISNPLLKRTAEIYFPRSFLFITPVCRLVTWLMFASTATSVWLTVAFTVDRFVAICCDKLKTKYCTERTAAVVIGTVSVLACLVTVPWGFQYESGEIIDGVSWYCVLKPSFTNSPSWVAFEIFHRIFYPCVPFILMLLFNILTVRRILATSRARRGLRGQKSGENDKDLEMENRRKSIVLLFSITASFILLWGTLVVFFIYSRITRRFVYSVTDPGYVTAQASIMLQVLSSCTNTCIYVLTQSKFREELKNAVKYPLNRILKLMKHFAAEDCRRANLVLRFNEGFSDKPGNYIVDTEFSAVADNVEECQMVQQNTDQLEI
ncbi:probable G-protein coupled receptor 139 [Mobula hypostoma]|uniref:probable G-protein coupled receptor 139 n=1 Tax=Mobula hypostoma TaxID=723540 RepID=UPI002FC2A55E